MNLEGFYMRSRTIGTVIALFVCGGTAFSASPRPVECSLAYKFMPCFTVVGGNLLVVDRSVRPDDPGGDDPFYNAFVAASDRLGGSANLLYAFARFMHDTDKTPTPDHVIRAYYRSGLDRILQMAAEGNLAGIRDLDEPIFRYLGPGVEVDQTWHVVCQGCSPGQPPEGVCAPLCIYDCLSWGAGCIKVVITPKE